MGIDLEAYPDRGCGGLCVRCLECPYPQCIHDAPRGITLRALSRQARAAELLREGQAVARVALFLRMDPRTVRDVRRHRP